jgi:hypothetical protein
MKPVGAAVHLRRGTVNLTLVKWLVIGSVPAAIAGVLIITSIGDSETVAEIIKLALGVALLLSVATMIGKATVSLRQYYRDRAAGIVGETGNSVFGITVKPIPTLLIGAIGGVVVGMTSVGSGSLIIVGLLLLYPSLRAGGLVGTDLVQAVPLVGAAALTYIILGEFQGETTIALLIGALPGVYLGARVSSRGQAGIIRRALVLVLFASGLKLVGVSPDRSTGARPVWSDRLDRRTQHRRLPTPSPARSECPVLAPSLGVGVGGPTPLPRGVDHRRTQTGVGQREVGCRPALAAQKTELLLAITSCARGAS